MKKILFIAVVTCSVVFSSCVKNNSCQNVSPASEETNIKQFASTHSITATKDTSGLYYQILDSGSSLKPNLLSTVYATYTARHLNYSIFDQQTTPAKFPLSAVIAGWQIGLPLVGKGGHILLIVPSAFGFGCSGSGPIGQNEILYFDITVTDIQ